jgi:flagellar basal body-associated protein FliL
VMVLEAVVLFAGFKFLGGGPKRADASEVESAEHSSEGGEKGEKGEKGEGEKKSEGEKGEKGKPSNPKKPVEIQVVEFRAINKARGQPLLFDVSIFAVTKGANEEKVRQTIKDRDALIKDRIRTIIAQSDPEKLGGGSEPGLETLRRQVKYQLDEIVGDGMIEEVLVPRCIPYRAEY